MARPKIEIDWKLVDGFCQMQCTLREIATYFNCSEDTIERRVREQFGICFADYFGKKRIAGLMSLRRNLFKQSEKNVAAAIFLAKNWLGMSDKQEIQQNVEFTDKTVREYTNEELQKIIAEYRLGRGRAAIPPTG